MVKQDGSLSQTNTHTVLKWTAQGQFAHSVGHSFHGQNRSEAGDVAGCAEGPGLPVHALPSGAAGLSNLRIEDG